MADHVTPSTSFEKWLKLTFRLLVGDHWRDVSSKIIEGDTTYRWCREIIRNSLVGLESSANELLSSAIASIKMELWLLRGGDFEQSQSSIGAFSAWEKTFAMCYDLTRNLPKLQDKLCALKLAIIAGTFEGCKEGEILSLKTKISQTFSMIKDESESVDSEREAVNKAFYIFVDFLSEFEINTDDERAKIGERISGRETEWKAPEPWCFGDYGKKEGQMEYPADVLINEQGDFLVLEQDSKGKNTIQRLQLFNNKGRYQRAILQRGRDGVTCITGMALDNVGNLVVTLKDEQNIGRVNVYDMKGVCVLVVKVLVPNPKFPPFFTSVAVDKEGRIFVVEHHEMSVHVYAEDGEFLFKFGQGGRTAQRGVFENISCVAISQNNELFICDPLRSVQVFNGKGEFLKFFKSSGLIPTHVVCGESEVYGVNRDAHALEVYSLDDGNMLRRVGGFGGELGRLWTPLGIARTLDGSIAVAEKESHRIQVLKI